MPCYHQVARLRPRTLNLLEPALAERVWLQLRHAFPDALQVTLMPTHVHLQTFAENGDELRVRTARVVGRSVRGLGKHTWEPLPPPELLRDRTQIRRNLRYIPLNPCRKGLAADPLAWRWSTYRDLFGASTEPWTSADRIAGVLGEPEGGFLERWHHYVSSDRCVSETGTPSPGLWVPARFRYPVVGPLDVRDAVAAATRGDPRDIERKGLPRALFLSAAREVGIVDAVTLGAMCKMSDRSVRSHRGRFPPGLDAVLTCLAEPRFRDAKSRRPNATIAARLAHGASPITPRALWD